MRPRVEGMNEVDDSILEFFDQQDDGISLPPSVVHYNLTEVYQATDKSRATVSRRMKQLELRGLLEKTHEEKGYYKLSDKGRLYLAGQIDAEDLRLPDDA